MRKALAVLLVIAGLAVALYPLAQSFYGDYRTGRHLEAFEEIQEREAQEPPAGEGQPAPRGEPRVAAEEPPAEEKQEEPYRGPPPIAVLEIPVIGLRLPVLEGASDYNLRYGAALLEGTAGIGEQGNTVLTAHRAHAYGRLFNRLDELEEGDEIVLVAADSRFSYRVFSTAVVEAEDTSYLADDPEKRRLTLVTCHPLYRPNPPYRLVVQAEMD